MNAKIALAALIVMVAAGVGGWYFGKTSEENRYRVETPAGVEEVEFTLPDMDGATRSSSEWAGKARLINFWATWCAPCLHEMPELERFYQDNKPRALVWGVTFEETPKRDILAFVEKLGVTYPILGHGQDPLTGYGRVRLLPTTFVINPDGLFHHRFEGAIMAYQIEEVIRMATP